jgi:putative DNA primase/helicase
VRILDLQADTGKGFGVIEELHGYNSPSDLADHLKAASARHYGHASRAFLQKLVQDPEGAREKVRASMNLFIEKHCPRDAQGQVWRAARRFALFAAAGELAKSFGITSWAEGEALAASASGFRGWRLALTTTSRTPLGPRPFTPQKNSSSSVQTRPGS